MNNIYPWFNKIWKNLNLIKNKLFQTILFYGSKGIGKLNLIKYFSQLLLCDKKNNHYPCNICHSCINFLNYKHLDFYFIKNKNENEIKIKKIKKINYIINTFSNFSKIRIILIYPIEKLNIYAANALLKFLEKPLKNIHFFLISNQFSNVIPTIISRCIIIFLKNPNYSISITWLKSKNIKNSKYLLLQENKYPIQVLKNYNNKKYNYFLNILSNPIKIISNFIKISEYLKKIKYKDLINIYQKWIFDLLSVKLTNIIYFYYKYKIKINLIIKNIKYPFLISNELKNIIKKYIYKNFLSYNLFIKNILINYLNLFK